MHAFRLLMLTVAFGLASCGGDGGSGGEAGKAPEGQVVATVGGEEVTMRELNMELRGAPIRDQEAMKRAERAAIQVIINRKILAKVAREQGLDDSAEFLLNRQRAEEALLAQELQRQVASKVQRPTREEAERYMAAHPHNFAERKIYIVDQIQFSVADHRDKLRQIAGLKSLNDVEQMLLAEGIEYRKVPSSIDARTTPPAVIEQIAKVPPGEAFLIPRGDMVYVSQVKESRLVPFTGEPAIAQAQQMLLNERIQQALAKQAEDLKSQAGKVTYKEGYGPPAETPAAPATDQPAQGENQAAAVE